VRRCLALPGRELFHYVDARGEVRRVTASDVNAYLREIAGDDYTAKDFRTWGASLLVVLAAQSQPAPRSATAARGLANDAIRFAAAQLHNTPTVCRRYYVHPRALDAVTNGDLGTANGSPTARFAAAERALLGLLDPGGRTRRAA